MTRRFKIESVYVPAGVDTAAPADIPRAKFPFWDFVRVQRGETLRVFCLSDVPLRVATHFEPKIRRTYPCLLAATGSCLWHDRLRCEVNAYLACKRNGKGDTLICAVPAGAVANCQHLERCNYCFNHQLTLYREAIGEKRRVKASVSKESEGPFSDRDMLSFRYLEKVLWNIWGFSRSVTQEAGNEA